MAGSVIPAAEVSNGLLPGIQAISHSGGVYTLLNQPVIGGITHQFRIALEIHF